MSVKRNEVKPTQWCVAQYRRSVMSYGLDQIAEQGDRSAAGASRRSRDKDIVRMSIAVGERFPAMRVLSTDGELDLANLWSSGPLVIAFHRMWCPFCQQAAIQLGDAAPELERLGAVTVIVYRENVDAVAAACTERQTAAVCVSDAHRSLEVAVGLERFKLRRYLAFSPRRLLAAHRAGSEVRGMGTNVLQGRGTYVVGCDGRVVYVHEATTAADIPPIDEIVSAVRATARP